MLAILDCSASPDKKDPMSPNAGVAAAGAAGAAAAGGVDTDEGGAGEETTGAGAAGEGAAAATGSSAVTVVEEEALEVAGGGATFGYYEMSCPRLFCRLVHRPQTLDTINTKKSFSLMLNDSIVLSSARILPVYRSEMSDLGGCLDQHYRNK
jgi:hypothetical protein